MHPIAQHLHRAACAAASWAPSHASRHHDSARMRCPRPLYHVHTCSKHAACACMHAGGRRGGQMCLGRQHLRPILTPPSSPWSSVGCCCCPRSLRAVRPTDIMSLLAGCVFKQLAAALRHYSASTHHGPEYRVESPKAVCASQGWFCVIEQGRARQFGYAWAGLVRPG